MTPDHLLESGREEVARVQPTESEECGLVVG